MKAVGIYLLGYAVLSMSVCAISGVIERSPYEEVMHLMFWPMLVILFGGLWSSAWSGIKQNAGR